MPEAREVQARVPRARRHIKHVRLCRQRDVRERCLHVAHVGENVPAAVVSALPVELLPRRALRWSSWPAKWPGHAG